jgi:A nuclease family of the HNH/ENDO VII superfamily with conserved AHH
MVSVPPPAPPAGPPPLTPPPNLVDKPGSQTPPSLAQQPAGPIVEVYPMGPPPTIDDLIIEKRNSEILGDNLRAANDYPPASGYEAHHIVPSGAGGSLMDEVRARLVSFGIDLNNALNGVWLPGSDAPSDATEAYHERLNNREYNDAVVEAFNNVSNAQQAIDALARIKTQLQNGTFPGVRPRRP